MQLVHVPPQFIDQAWRDGAFRLDDALTYETTIDQLKLLLARGERNLFCGLDGDSILGWMVANAEQYANVRVFHVYALHAPNHMHAEFFAQLQAMARQQGCSEVRCCAKPAQARLYRMKWAFEPVYETLRVKV